MSMTPVPVCWQTTVTAENEKESCSTGFSACGGSRKRHSTIPPQCDLRGAFLSYGNEVSYTMKTPVGMEENSSVPTGFLCSLQLTLPLLSPAGSC